MSRSLLACVLVTVLTTAAFAQGDVRSPLSAPVKVRLGMANVPALSPLWLLMPRPGHTPDFLRPTPAEPCTPIGEELERVRATRPVRAHDELARVLACTPGAAGTPRGRAMLEDPARAVQDLADLLDLAWRALMEPHWTRVRTLLEADAAFHTRRLAEEGPARMFADLHPSLSWADGTLSAESPGEQSRTLDGGAGLLLVPAMRSSRLALRAPIIATSAAAQPLWPSATASSIPRAPSANALASSLGSVCA